MASMPEIKFMLKEKNMNLFTTQKTMLNLDNMVSFTYVLHMIATHLTFIDTFDVTVTIRMSDGEKFTVEGFREVHDFAMVVRDRDHDRAAYSSLDYKSFAYYVEKFHQYSCEVEKVKAKREHSDG